MKKDMETLKNLLLRYEDSSENDDELLCGANEKLAQIFQDHSDDDTDNEKIEFVRAFAAADEVQKRKLLSYCLDFVDPTVHAEATFQGEQIYRERDEQIVQLAFLTSDELYKLHQFVKRHQSDISFGEIVYKIMDKHKMNAPQVYKNALLRRQDFARVTDSRCKNVTRKMVWQIVIGLHCSLEEADDVLFSAGYIRRNTRMDLIMQYFIENENYDIEAIDAALAEWGLKTFTCE